jgi:hypothetical protein
MKRKNIILVSLVIVIFVSGCLQQEVPSGKYNEFAKCLTDKGVKMYGAFWCGKCAKQKNKFEDSFQYINYIECDPKCIKDKEGNLPTVCKGHESQSALCIEKGVELYPHWEFPDGSSTEGILESEFLAEKSGCELSA